MSKLFKKKLASEIKSVRFPIRMTENDRVEIGIAAAIRQLSVGEFMLRAALGRKADIRYEVEIILALRDATKSIRDLHAALVERGIVPPEDEWRPVIKEAIDAMLRIDSKNVVIVEAG